MKLISHRGNINGKDLLLENSPSYIETAIYLGYNVEIDVWYKDGFWLGHDAPEYKIPIEFLTSNSSRLWIHCKNFKALSKLLKYDLTIFYHEKEEYTIISNKLIWAHNIKTVDNTCIIPLLSKMDVEAWKPSDVYGVCSDYIELLK
jgi:hypothetical protein